ncbi:hypothetical protein Tsubulata_005784, partial [Turnera subulata]
MPFKAFAVASLFVGSAASASVAGLQASGIHKLRGLFMLHCLNSRAFAGRGPNGGGCKYKDRAWYSSKDSKGILD